MLAVEEAQNARDRSRIETRRLLLDAAMQLFAEQGVARTRAADISRAAGVAVGTLYLHFADKEALLRQILFRGLVELHAGLRRNLERPHVDVAQAVRDHVEVIVRLAEEHPAFCRILFGTEVATTAMGADVLNFLTRMQENRLREGMTEGYFRSDFDPAVAALALVGMQMHVMSWWIQDPSRASREAVIDTLARVQLSGLYPGPRLGG